MDWSEFPGLYSLLVILILTNTNHASGQKNKGLRLSKLFYLRVD